MWKRVFGLTERAARFDAISSRRITDDAAALGRNYSAGGLGKWIDFRRTQRLMSHAARRTFDERFARILHAFRRAKLTLSSRRRPKALVSGFVPVREKPDFIGLAGAGGEN